MNNGKRVKVDKLDFARNPPADARTPLLHDSEVITSPVHHHSRSSSHGGGFFENVAEGIAKRDRERIKRETTRYVSFAWAIVSCLCAGSITAYSLYGHLFQTRLHYTQYRVNLVAVLAEVALYIPVSVWGFIVDRYGPRVTSLLSAVFFGFGYILAAYTYRSGPPPTAGGDGFPFWVMVLAFIGIGMGTGSMYLGSVACCAKNFGRGKHKGFALAAPIASFGLSGMWQSQIGSQLLYEVNPDGSKGEVDVFRFFIFLGILFAVVGAIGGVLLRVVDESELIDEAVEDLERSGLLDESEFFQRTPAVTPGVSTENHGYGTIGDSAALNDSVASLATDEGSMRKLMKQETKRKKAWLLNAESRRFLADSTMWWLAAGFFLVTGPGEAFINNLGTIIGTLYPDPASSPHPPNHPRPAPTSAATHVSITALTSTIARLASGMLSDLLAPVADPHQHYHDPAHPAGRGPTSLTSSLASMDPLSPSNDTTSTTAAAPPPRRALTVSRVALLLFATVLFSIGLVLLASGGVQGHAAQAFWIVSATVGTGYGAAFSLVPLIISCVWGVENFGTNWGTVAMVPAPAAAVYSALYAAVYQAAAPPGAGGDAQCFGVQCYALTFWVMAVSAWLACGSWFWAWRGGSVFELGKRRRRRGRVTGGHPLPKLAAPPGRCMTEKERESERRRGRQPKASTSLPRSHFTPEVPLKGTQVHEMRAGGATDVLALALARGADVVFVVFVVAVGRQTDRQTDRQAGRLNQKREFLTKRDVRDALRLSFM